MKVKVVRILDEYSDENTVTLYGVYNCDGVDSSGDVAITDDKGDASFLFKGEYEVVADA